MKRILVGLGAVLFAVSSIDSMNRKRSYSDSELYKIRVQSLFEKASTELRTVQEESESDADTSSIEELIEEATENPEALEKVAELACDDKTDLDGAMKLWEISGSIKDHSHKKQEEINKVSAMIGFILSDWCCGHARAFDIYLSRYYNGWFDPLVSDDKAK